MQSVIYNAATSLTKQLAKKLNELFFAKMCMGSLEASTLT